MRAQPLLFAMLFLCSSEQYELMSADVSNHHLGYCLSESLHLPCSSYLLLVMLC